MLKVNAEIRANLVANCARRAFTRLRCLHEDKSCNIGKLDSLRKSYLDSTKLREKLGIPKPSLETRIARVDEALVIQHSNAAKRMVNSYLQDKNEIHGSLKEAAMHLQKAEEHSNASSRASVLTLRQESAMKVIVLGMGHLVFAISDAADSKDRATHIESAIKSFRNAILIDPSWKIEISQHFIDVEKRCETGAMVCKKLREELNLQPSFHQP